MAAPRQSRGLINYFARRSSATGRRQRAFTLVELLVVITIIGMLMALLLPAIQSAREAGRRNTCANNMRNDGFALSQNADSKRMFPGYAQKIAKNNAADGMPGYVLASWVVSILPNLERNDMYQNWVNPVYPVNGTSGLGAGIGSSLRSTLVSQISVLVCPSNSNPDLGDNPLSYVVNTGSALTASDNSSSFNWPEDGNSGVFFNHAQYLPTSLYTGSIPGQKRVTMDFLNTNDGTSHTVMVSENLQAGTWGTDPGASPGSAFGTTPFLSDFGLRQSVGFNWFLTGNQDNATPPDTSVYQSGGVTTVPLASGGTSYNQAAIGINESAKVISGLPVGTYNMMATSSPTGLAYARPSSNHPGGVNMVFCDGHLSFVNEEIPYRVFTQLMTPYQKNVVVDYNSGSPIRAGSASSGNPMSPTQTSTNKVYIPWAYTLNEADYQ